MQWMICIIAFFIVEIVLMPHPWNDSPDRSFDKPETLPWE
jgi:hypothetical protein